MEKNSHRVPFHRIGEDYPACREAAQSPKVTAMKERNPGGARSGKSLLAEKRGAASGLRVVYLATAEACDGEMAVSYTHLDVYKRQG